MFVGLRILGGSLGCLPPPAPPQQEKNLRLPVRTAAEEAGNKAELRLTVETPSRLKLQDFYTGFAFKVPNQQKGFRV